jgi:hypothetical protein
VMADGISNRSRGARKASAKAMPAIAATSNARPAGPGRWRTRVRQEAEEEDGVQCQPRDEGRGDRHSTAGRATAGGRDGD